MASMGYEAGMAGDNDVNILEVLEVLIVIEEADGDATEGNIVVVRVISAVVEGEDIAADANRDVLEAGKGRDKLSRFGMRRRRFESCLLILNCLAFFPYTSSRARSALRLLSLFCCRILWSVALSIKSCGCPGADPRRTKVDNGPV